MWRLEVDWEGSELVRSVSAFHRMKTYQCGVKMKSTSSGSVALTMCSAITLNVIVWFVIGVSKSILLVLVGCNGRFDHLELVPHWAFGRVLLKVDDEVVAVFY